MADPTGSLLNQNVRFSTDEEEEELTSSEEEEEESEEEPFYEKLNDSIATPTSESVSTKLEKQAAVLAKVVEKEVPCSSDTCGAVGLTEITKKSEGNREKGVENEPNNSQEEGNSMNSLSVNIEVEVSEDSSKNVDSNVPEKFSPVFIPNEIYLNIFSFLRLYDVVRLGYLSRRMYVLLRSDALWEPIVKREFERYVRSGRIDPKELNYDGKKSKRNIFHRKRDKRKQIMIKLGNELELWEYGDEISIHFFNLYVKTMRHKYITLKKFRDDVINQKSLGKNKQAVFLILFISISLFFVFESATFASCSFLFHTNSEEQIIALGNINRARNVTKEVFSYEEFYGEESRIFLVLAAIFAVAAIPFFVLYYVLLLYNNAKLFIQHSKFRECQKWGRLKRYRMKMIVPDDIITPFGFFGYWAMFLYIGYGCFLAKGVIPLKISWTISFIPFYIFNLLYIIVAFINFYFWIKYHIFTFDKNVEVNLGRVIRNGKYKPERSMYYMMYRTAPAERFFVNGILAVGFVLMFDFQFLLLGLYLDGKILQSSSVFFVLWPSGFYVVVFTLNSTFLCCFFSGTAVLEIYKLFAACGCNVGCVKRIEESASKRYRSFRDFVRNKRRANPILCNWLFLFPLCYTSHNCISCWFVPVVLCEVLFAFFHTIGVNLFFAFIPMVVFLFLLCVIYPFTHLVPLCDKKLTMRRIDFRR